MPSLKTLKLRIKSIRSTQKITKAMKMVAASKLKRAREKAEASVEYANQMTFLVQNIAQNIVPSAASQMQLLHGTGKEDVNLIVLITSDRGLCGGFNQNMMKLARRKIHELESKGKKVKLMFVGKKGYDLLKKAYSSKILAHYEGIGNKGLKFEEARTIADNILGVFEKGEFDTCTVLYSKFKSVISQIPTAQQIIPLEQDNSECALKSGCEYEPNEEEIIKHLLPKNIAVQIYRALLESSASEQGSRMSAMENATRNSGEIIKKLNLVYNRTRQAYITKELIEIISGAEAV